VKSFQWYADVIKKVVVESEVQYSDFSSFDMIKPNPIRLLIMFVADADMIVNDVADDTTVLY